MSIFEQGGDLFDEIHRRRRFRESEAASMVNDIVNALYYLHCRHIVHRDLKPENLLVCSDYCITFNWHMSFILHHAIN